MKKTEICLYCGDEYVPKRRGAQKFCTNSCRSRHWQTKQNIETKEVSIKLENTVEKQSLKVEKMSLAGVGNAAAGVAAVEGLKSLLTSQENKPATKADIKNLTNKIIKRYHLVKNIPKRLDGALPYFDMETGHVIYSPYAL